MTEQPSDQIPEQEPQEPGQKSQDTQEAWREVGRQFQTLGDTLAAAFRTAWQDEATQQRVNEMRSGVESMVRDVGQVLRDYSNSPEGQRVRSEAKRAADNVRVAGEQTMTDVRPHLLSALKQVNNELQKMIDRMGQTPAPEKSETTNTVNQDGNGQNTQ